MTDEPVLYHQRIDELMRLIEAHLERGALDEGNATAFDGIIDAWLAEEITRLDQAVTASANNADAVTAAAESEREHRQARERAADERWQKATERDSQSRESADEAIKASHDARVRAAEQRLAWASSQLGTARDELLGTAPHKTHVVAHLTDPHQSADEAASLQDHAKVA